MAKTTSVDTTSDGSRPREPAGVVQYWLAEINAAKKREKDFRKDGQRILEIYDGEKSESTPFNILFSNTETLIPAIYSTVPRPVVQRRFKDADPLGKAAAQAGQRVLEFLLDTNVEGYETFDRAMRLATLDAALPGRAVTSIKYDADLGGASEEPAPDEEAPTPYMASELVCPETRSWNRVYFGYARKWSKVPWVAYEEHVTKMEATRLFGRAIAGTLKYTDAEQDNPDAEESRGSDERNTGEKKTVCIYQIWDKAGGRKLRYISEQYAEGYLKVEDDPLELTGFFNCPQPLQFIEKTNTLLPTAPYKLYENQAKELNRLTIRINRIVEAIKARGVYDTELGEELANLMKADDNALVPADKSSSLAAEKGLQNAIWFMPLDQLITTLVQLYAAREACKQVIYEITGISDIIRGQSTASETATAQTIKNQWGTLRLRRIQKEVQRYAKDLLRLMLELAASKFSEETWAKMTGLPFVTTAQRAQLEQIALAAQALGQPLDPQTEAKLAAPVWGQVLAMLRDDQSRAYRIDIETNSTVEPEAAEDQKQIAELMTAMGQYLNGIAPLVAKGVMPFGVAQSMLLAIARRFRFGSEIEEYIQAMQPPRPEESESHAKEIDLHKKQAEMEVSVKAFQEKKALLEKEADLEMREMKLKMEVDRFKMQQQMAEQKLGMAAERENQKIQHEQKVATLQNTKFKTENIVNQKADATITRAVSALQAMMAELLKSQATLVKAVSAPKRRKAIRDASGRIAEVEEVVA